MLDTPYGVTVGIKDAGASLPPSLISDMQNIGLSWLRLQVPWNLIETSKGVYNWHLFDEAVAKCNAASISLCLTMKQPPSFWQVNGLPSPQGTAAFAQAIASRYNGNAGHGIVQAIEDGNEDFDAGAGTSPAPLAACLNACYPVIKAAHPDCIVVMAATLQRNSTHIKAFMDGVWSGAARKFDVANFHFYTCIPNNGHYPPDDGSVPNVPSLPQYIDLLRQSHAQAGHPGFPTWCTEFGFATTPNFGRPSRCVVDEATSWKYLKYCYDQMQQSSFVEKAFVFTLGYASSPDGMSLVQPHQTVAYSGLKAYVQQFPDWQGGSDPPPPPPPPGGPTQAQIDQAIALMQQAIALLSPPS